MSSQQTPRSDEQGPRSRVQIARSGRGGPSRLVSVVAVDESAEAAREAQRLALELDADPQQRLAAGAPGRLT